MTLPTIELRDVPRPWRPIVSFALFVLAIGTAAVLFLGWVKAEARAEARDETKVIMAGEVAAFKSAALEAARDAASQAVRESVAPIASGFLQHKAEDDERVHQLDRRVDRLETRR